MRTKVVVSGLLALGLALAGCSKSAGGQPGATPGGGAVTAEGLVLKPDVAVIERPGSPVVKGTDKDGYLLDGSAPGIDQLKPGKVVLIKNEAAGRIKTINRQGNDVHVAVDPVGPAEVIQDGKIAWKDVTLDPGQMKLAKWDDPNGVTEVPHSTSSPEPSTPGKPAETGTPTTPEEPTPAPKPTEEPEGLVAKAASAGPPSDLSGSVTVGDYSVSGGITDKGDGKTMTFTLGLSRTLFSKGKGKGSIGASIGGTINVDISRLGNSGLLEMAGGRIKSADVAANVLGAISVNIKAQSGADAMLAFNDAVDIPMEWRQPMPIYGIPFLWIFKFKLGVGPALSSKNSTLNFTVKADVGARGGIQFLNNLPFAPASLNPKDPEYQIGGAGLGVLGFVITARPRINFGLGFGAGLAVGKPVNPADASATAFVDAVFSAGVTQGSPLGMIMCKNITVNMQVRGGFETKFLDAGTEGVKPITGDKRIFDKAIPEVKACHLG